MEQRRTWGLVIVVAMVALAGCLGGNGGAEATPGDGGSSAGGQVAGGGGSGEWCPAGQSMQMANPQTGERVSWQVHGVVEHDGRQVCRVTWEADQGDVQRMELYFSEDDDYQRLVSYDASGAVVNEVRLDGSTPASEGDGADAWCGDAASFRFTDPQTGEQASFETQGVVTHEGRQTCKAVWETNQGEIQRVEMYYTEERDYQHIVYYDGQGTVVNEVRTGGS